MADRPPKLPKPAPLIARALVALEYMRATDAAATVGIADRTLRAWRAEFSDHPEVVEAMARIEPEFRRAWIRRSVAALSDMVTKLSDMVASCEGPEHIRQVAGAVKIVGELMIAEQGVRGELAPTDTRAPAADANVVRLRKPALA